MIKKKENFLRHFFLSLFSSEYRHQLMLEQGKEIWQKLNTKLPKAVGVLEDDKERMRLFAEEIKNLDFAEKHCLVLWLEMCLYDLEHNFCEHTTASLEEHERKWKQIYRTHLELLS